LLEAKKPFFLLLGYEACGRIKLIYIVQGT